MARQPGSLRSLGVGMVAIDKPTLARLKRLAGDTPLSHKVRELVELGEALESAGGGGGEIPLPGQERMVSPNTMSALNLRFQAVDEKLNAVLMWAFPDYFEGSEVKGVNSLISEKLEQVSKRILESKSKTEGVDGQSELKLA